MFVMFWSCLLFVVSIGVVVILQRLGLGGRWAQRFAHSDVLSFLGVLVGVAALYVAVVTTIDARKGGAEQERALERSRSALEAVQRTVESERAILDQSRVALEKQLGALELLNERVRIQSEIIAAQEKRALARLARKPRLELYLGDVRFGSAKEYPTVSEGPTTTVVEVTLKNVGAATIRELSFAAMAVAPSNSGVSLECPICGGSYTNGMLDDRYVVLNYPSLRPENQIVFPLTIHYPSNGSQFPVDLFADAENLPRQALGTIGIDPAKLGASKATPADEKSR